MFNFLKREISKIDFQDAKKVRQFCFLFGAVFSLFAFLKFQTALFPFLVVPALAFFAFGFFKPLGLKKFYRLWMTFALILGIIISNLVLILFFYLILTPLGLLVKIFGKDLLDEKIEKNRPSYWRERQENFEPERYKKMF